MNSNPQGSDVSESVASASKVQSLDTLSTEEFLSVVGLRVRNQRSAMSMSRKKLAEVSGVSERYLAQLESGQGNMSIALLRKVTSAIDMSLGVLLSSDAPELNSHSGNTHQQSGNAATAHSHLASHESRTFPNRPDQSSVNGKLVT